MLFPRPGEALDEGLEAGEAGEAGRRPPGGAPPGWEEALLAGGAGAFPVLPAGLPLPLPLLLLLLLLLVLTDVSVRFKAAGPISAYNREERTKKLRSLRLKMIKNSQREVDKEIVKKQ